MLKSLILLIILSTAVQACSVKEVKPVLEYKIKKPKIESEDSPLLILLHGLGSNEEDLFQLTQYLPEDYLIVCARAPYVQAEKRFEWYEMDFSTGQPVGNFEQAEDSRLLLKKFITQLKSLHTFDHKKIIIGGFSQGGIMSYSLGLTEPNLVHGIMVLSGRLSEEIKPMIRIDKQDAVELLIIHGTQDKVLPVKYARQAKSYLEQKKFRIEYHEINVGHTINNETIQLINKWLLKFKEE
ncbi:dienelactone hydrolase family protein [Saprospiraceae bacterium]|nr:dienelactone hydrolase family protein [Saprospiraceae bacterium]